MPDAEGLERFELCRGLDPLGYQANLALDGVVADPRDERLARRIGSDPAHESDVELYEVRLELEDVPKARVAGARVVDREADAAAERRQAALQRDVVVDDDVLGDLNDDRASKAGEEWLEPTPS